MVNNRFLEEVPDALMQYPCLYLNEDEGCLQGYIDLQSDGNYVDRYEIKIIPTEYYPLLYPKVYEIGGRIPINIDWHVYDDGHWCFGPPVEEMMKCCKGITLVPFIASQVTEYLFSQTFRRENGYFYKERSHSFIGVVEFYQDYFCTKNIKTVLLAMSIVSNGTEPKGNTKCFCGSGKKFQKCHRHCLRILGKSAQTQVIEDFKKLRTILNV